MLKKSGVARALDPCRRLDGSWALGTSENDCAVTCTRWHNNVTGFYLLICHTSYELFSGSVGFIANLPVCLENYPDIQFRMAGPHVKFFTEAAYINT